MFDSIDLVRVIKKASVEAVKADKPVSILFGTVITSNPIRINVEQKMTLTKEQIVIPQRLVDQFTIGDNVILLQVQGGQSFIILDKVGG